MVWKMNSDGTSTYTPDAPAAPVTDLTQNTAGTSSNTGGGIINTTSNAGTTAATATANPDPMSQLPAQTGTTASAVDPKYLQQAQGLYQTHLGRAGENAGVNYWAQQLASGQSFDSVNKNFQTAAKQNYGDYLTNANSQWATDPAYAAQMKKDLGGAQAGSVASTATDQYANQQNLNKTAYNDLYSGDIYGTADYNQAQGLTPLQYADGSGVKNNTIGYAPAGSTTLLKTQSAYQLGIDPNDVYRKAGLATPTGSYTGPNHSWVPSGAAAQDTPEAMQARFKALQAAGMEIGDAWVEANNGFSSPQVNAPINQGIVDNTPGGGIGTVTSNGAAYNGGIINRATGVGNNAANGTGAFQGASGAYQYNPAALASPATWGVTADQTAQGQMARMIDPNNPYYQAWANAGAQDAAARGFTGNSSIRDSAIMDAVMRNATPIASADAATYAKAAGYNTDQLNQNALQNFNAANVAGQFNSGQSNTLLNNVLGINSNQSIAKLNSDTTLGVAGINAATSKYNTDSNANTSLATAGISANTQRAIAELSAASQKTIAGMNNASQQTLNAAHDANSAAIATNQNTATAWNNYIAGIANIQSNSAMDANAKMAAVQNLTDAANAAGLKVTLQGTAAAAGTGMYVGADGSASGGGSGAASGSLVGPVTPTQQAAINQANVDVSNQLTFP
ncbi:DUF4214 domain-containing protein [Undibacterium sp. Ji50W]|uniref:DUF4214 domain-containing protein n=1 Tax=Undibacterium sp. Ji50W TaxID=3413041 RepID=UPI003BF151A3